MRRICCVVVLFSLNCSALLAQQEMNVWLEHQDSKRAFSQFLNTQTEPSEISGTRFLDYHSGIKKPYLFNGSFQFPFTLGIERKRYKNIPKYVHALQFVPEVQIRIYQNDPTFGDKSKPVRTPSYVPKISYYLSSGKYWKEQAKTAYYLGVTALHHSNGGDGWEFDYPDSNVNIYDGSFSESLFFQFKLGGKLALKEKKINTDKKFNQVHEKWNFMSVSVEQLECVFWEGSIELHPRYFSNEKFYESKLYGGNRVHFNLTWQSKKRYKRFHREDQTWKEIKQTSLQEVRRLSFVSSYITDLTYNSGNQRESEKIPLQQANKRLNVTLSFYQNLFHIPYLALFAQVGYMGSDTYNIYFQESNFIARIGLAFGLFENQLVNDK